MNKNKKLPILIAFLITLVTLIIVNFDGLVFFEDETCDSLFKSVAEYAAFILFWLALCLTYFGKKGLIPNFTPAYMPWAMLGASALVVVANFPWFALFSNSAHIDRPDLIWLFCLQCLGIGLFEELVFRHTLFPIVCDYFKSKKNEYFWSVIVAAAIFALAHLINLFSSSFLAVLMQVGYSFLIGVMLCLLYDTTKHIWWCVIVHAAFDFGGKLIPTLGNGAFMDLVFWILTAVCGAICIAVYATYLFRENRKRSKIDL